MTLQIRTADQRMQERGKLNIMITAPHGVGKTTLARTLPYAGKSTLFIDLESGMEAVKGDVVLPDGTPLGGFAGGDINVRREAAKLGVHPWAYTKALACLLGGPDPAAKAGVNQETGDFHSPYSADAYNAYASAIGDPAMFSGFDTIFVDSGSVASRSAWSWSLVQPRAYNKQGKQDTLGAYGLVGDEMIEWATQLQHITDKSVIVLFALDVIKDKDIPGRVSYAIQAIGGRTERELPGIFDNVMTLGTFKLDQSGNASLDYEKGQHRGLICTSANGYGVPAKDRTGRAAPIEPPNIAALMTKLAGAKRADQVTVTTDIPPHAAAAAEPTAATAA
ncbi:AAA family ATPase [Thalassobaculum sp. OXR-137]|uniref:AAA family ATPase n=1 Tax=Thalassobaculum sp. OXR-137 TaxID=3100173 RepID=UPI002AC98201|nr:AAA family ATPase [Thalassobaculum sp. OXR-137]WPZ36745.1 AAA family ATPase [Thalassobaculum sp. OXR-137]